MSQRRRTIVIADDSEASRAALVKDLTEAGYDVIAVTNGREVLTEVEKGSVALAVLDVMMPVLDGYETLRFLRRNHSQVELPVIMLTARAAAEDVIHALRLGANDYSVKPVDFATLRARIETHLKLAGTETVRLGDYELVRRLAAGSMGIVHEARCVRDGRAAAVKVLPRSLTVDPVNVKRFLREAQLVARVNHPNVVKLFEAGQDGETYFIAMELVRGSDLFSLANANPMPASLVLDTGRQLTLALQCLKDHGIVHRDVKPHNVLLTPDGVVKLTDFGIARNTEVDNEITRPGLAVGSLSYSSVEQMCGTSDYRSDIYSLGATLYFLLTGKPPFPANISLPQLLDVKMRTPPSAAALSEHVPAELDALVRWMMDPKPGERPQKHEELLGRLNALQQTVDALEGTTLRQWYVDHVRKRS